MRAIAEFRIPESYANEFLSPEIKAQSLGFKGFMKKINVPVGGDLYEKIGEITRFVRARDDKYFFLGWDIRRIYSKKELDAAELLLLKIRKTFEPAGLECGTIYDNQNVCDLCGAGLRQVSDLILDLNAVPKNADIARTISNEIIISQNLAEFLLDNKVTGCELKPVHHIDPKVRRKAWFQLIATSFVNIDPETKAGNDPFDDDINNEYRCKKGHTLGLNLLSEVSIRRESWNKNDIVASKELFGVNRGLLQTYPLLMMSRRISRLLLDGKFRGFNIEAVRLIP